MLEIYFLIFIDRFIFVIVFCRHGIGHYLSVHEGPQRIGTGYSQYEEGLTDGVFLSDEPGFYKPDDFGIRIENDMEVVLTNRSVYDSTQFLRFETITLIPYERSLIDISLLTKAHVQAINEYHARIVQEIEPLLQGDTAALAALRTRTASLISESTTVAPGSSSSVSSSISMNPSSSVSSSISVNPSSSVSSSISVNPSSSVSSSISVNPLSTTSPPSKATLNTGGLSILISLILVLIRLLMNNDNVS